MMNESERLTRDKAVLREREDSMRLLIESLQEYAIFLLDAHGRVATWNAGAEQLKGYRADEILGKHFACFYSEEDRAAGKPAKTLQAALANGHTQDEGWRVRKDGQRFWARVTTSRVLDQDGRLLGFSKVTRDRTVSRNMELALQEKNIELRKMLEARDLFLANMSHELRTPLNGIIGFAEFLADEKPGPLSPKQKEYLEDILHSGKHLLHVINDVLDLAKVEAGKMELAAEAFSIAKAVHDVYAALELTAQKKQLQIGIRLDPDFDEVTLDRNRFKQVLYNLFSNAVKFTDEGGSVEVITAKINKDYFRLVVADTGIGIKPEDLKRLFRQFEQINPGQRRGQGTGLGLALTRRIVELQSGTIDVESEFGKGTKFTIVLPMVLPPFDSDSQT
ncbi:MAG: PAS domain-containing sensor histidine kinase [Verrucomicrobia bacterium]|nr:PAS domain-containing sensor histidine kinase [Verrucomicrobiota bacterium]MBV8482955.1 PAS domain-containing sensor histidine kinase [Verrucomicrobiota bacterium]